MPPVFPDGGGEVQRIGLTCPVAEPGSQLSLLCLELCAPRDSQYPVTVFQCCHFTKTRKSHSVMPRLFLTLYQALGSSPSNGRWPDGHEPHGRGWGGPRLVTGNAPSLWALSERRPVVHQGALKPNQEVFVLVGSRCLGLTSLWGGYTHTHTHTQEGA